MRPLILQTLFIVGDASKPVNAESGFAAKHRLANFAGPPAESPAGEATLHGDDGEARKGGLIEAGVQGEQPVALAKSMGADQEVG
jgi:hypothetical protein